MILMTAINVIAMTITNVVALTPTIFRHLPAVVQLKTTVVVSNMMRTKNNITMMIKFANAITNHLNHVIAKNNFWHILSQTAKYFAVFYS